VDASSGRVIIQSAAESDAGQWECTASNDRGEATALTQLNLIG